MKKYYIVSSILFLSFFHCIHTMDTTRSFTENINTLKNHLQKKLDPSFLINTCTNNLHAISKAFDDTTIQNTQAYEEFKTLDLSDILEYLSSNSKRTLDNNMFDSMRKNLAKHNITCDSTIKIKRQNFSNTISEPADKKYSIAERVQYYTEWNSLLIELFPAHIHADKEHKQEQPNEKIVQFNDPELAEQHAKLQELKRPKKNILPNDDIYKEIKQKLEKLEEYKHNTIASFVYKIKTALNTKKNNDFYKDDIEYLQQFGKIFLSLQFSENESNLQTLQQEYQTKFDALEKAYNDEKQAQELSIKNTLCIPPLHIYLVSLAGLFALFKLIYPL